ncbi:beta-galactosidase [Asticcacaulis tiandongensis]|uniref:beta-galactosidase n=1 Tax=Asticcacaulis tiandongensis TaxID=2565365 RepID=UPI0011280D66|nr:beta-galactosidase [Asticcacaulis tiandongensis]
MSLFKPNRYAVSMAALLLMASPSLAETYRVDAATPPEAPREGLLNLGSNTAPDGRVLSVNNRYLMLNNQPVLPVMGEFHYTRFPEAYWEEQLLKMKAAGVNVIATYVIWQHHQEQPDSFNWSGNRDLRRFIQLAQKHDLYVYLRPGPWAHAEVRFGGVPDWVVHAVPTRGNDPTYLSYVDRYFGEVFKQAEGLLWKDGGPIIGIQIENEYNRTGPLQGREHIGRLKDMMIAHGFDLPLYTVTGWDNAVFPRGEVIPVFGSYVDEPWSASGVMMPPKSSFVFQFGVRNEQGLGAQGRTSTQDDGARDADITPFFGAEYGGGVPQMYRRRPLIAPDDIADMLVTKVGSGVNLMGYYMFQGGQNPAGTPYRHESIATGSPNDVPYFGYDFQAPLAQYGHAHPVLNRIRPVHYFLQAFGDRLAPMTVYAPDQLPKDTADLETLRWAFRGDGQSGFVFVNNHVREYETPAHADTRFNVVLAGKTLTLPSKGVTVEKGDAFIWPVHFDLAGIDLKWATAQPVTQIRDSEGELFVFSGTAKIAPEFVFDRAITVRGGTQKTVDGQKIVTPRSGEIVTLSDASGKRSRFLYLEAAQADRLAVIEMEGPNNQSQTRLILSDAHAFGSPEGGLSLRQTSPDFAFAAYPALGAQVTSSLALKRGKAQGVFATYSARAAEVSLEPEVSVLRPVGKAPPLKLHGPRNTPVAPVPESFAAAGAWKIKVPQDALKGVSDVYMDVAYEGDVARLFSGPEMLDDEYFIGRTWRIGLKRYADKLDQPLTVTIMPLREDSTVYLDPSVKPQFEDGQVARIKDLRLVPEYDLTLR